MDGTTAADAVSAEFKSSFAISDLVCLKEERSAKKSDFKNKDVSFLRSLEREIFSFSSSIEEKRVLIFLSNFRISGFFLRSDSEK